MLSNLELMKDGRLTNAAAVLYLKHGTMEYPQLLLRLARFQGTDNRVFLDNKQVRGNVFLMLEEAMALYYDSDLSGLFLSVNPMNDKYQSISLYGYFS